MALEDTIQTNLTKPKKVTGDLGSVEMHDIQGQIAAAQYLNNRQGAMVGTAGIGRTWKLIPPGAVSEQVSETQPVSF